MDYQDILFEKKEGYAIVTFNRPDKLNALKERTKVELNDALDVVEADPEIHGLIITGSGKGFMAGADLSEIPADRKGYEAREMSVKGQALFNKIERLSKPVIAAVNGYALGGGTELALACDLRCAGEKAKFGVPETGIGVMPCYGGTQRLPRLIGPGAAKDLLLTARHVKADEALQLGLVNRVFPQDELMAQTEELMKSIIKNAPVALYAAKRAVNEGMDMVLDRGLALEADLNQMLADTYDAHEGVNSFNEKRKPVFEGR